MAAPAGFYTRRDDENKAGMLRGGAQVTPLSLKSHGDAGPEIDTDAVTLSVTDIT